MLSSIPDPAICSCEGTRRTPSSYANANPKSQFDSPPNWLDAQTENGNQQILLCQSIQNKASPYRRSRGILFDLSKPMGIRSTFENQAGTLVSATHFSADLRGRWRTRDGEGLFKSYPTCHRLVDWYGRPGGCCWLTWWWWTLIRDDVTRLGMNTWTQGSVFDLHDRVATTDLHASWKSFEWWYLKPFPFGLTRD